MSIRTILALLFVGLPARAAERTPTYPEHQDLSYYLDGSGEKKPVRTAEDWRVRRGHILEGMQAAMGRLPGDEKRVPLDVRVEEEVKTAEGVRRKITYQSAPDRRVAAYLFLPETKAGEKRPAVLCLHPTGALGKGIVAGLGGKANRQYAAELAGRGCVTLAPDYPSFGDDRTDFAADTDWASGTMRAIWDNVRAVDLLRSMAEVDGENIGCIGHSLGGHNAMFTAAFEPRLKAVVSSCGFTRFHKYYGGKLAGWTSPRYMPRIASEFGNDPGRVPFDFPEVAGALAPRAFFVSAPERDDNFEVSGVRDCVASAQFVYDLLGKPGNLRAVYPKAGHDFPDEAREQAYSFLDRHLKGG